MPAQKHKYLRLRSLAGFKNTSIYRSAALPASQTPVFTAPARKRLQQHMQKHSRYCYLLLRVANSHSQTQGNTCVAAPARKRLQHYMQKHTIYGYVLIRVAKNKSQARKNTCVVAPGRKRLGKYSRTMVNAALLCSGSRKTLVIAVAVRKSLQTHCKNM